MKKEDANVLGEAMPTVLNVDNVPNKPVTNKVEVVVGTVVCLEDRKYLHMWSENRGIITRTPNVVPGVGYFVRVIDVPSVIHQIIYGTAYIVRQKTAINYKLK